ncbi:unnamed protein product [Cuscuta europaea]|uniref:Uncharacterized protein n=1 Tax=Cuscuta europaea TaxID=41803 RepID=A0A9P0Z0V7_CUSEU|nr:unnamed protein product [Cuscuta europaea]
MDKSEPKLAPEWLKSVGNKPASAATSSLQSGVYEASTFARSKSSPVNGTSNNLGRPLATNQSNRTSNRSNSDHHPLSYSNFGRNRRSRDRYVDKYDNSDVAKKNLGNRTLKDGFNRPSQLMTTSERHSEKGIMSSCSGENNNKSYPNGPFPDKYESERGFVSHGTGMGRALSPGVSAVKNGDKWTSLLAEVPSPTVSDVADGGLGTSSAQVVSSFIPLTMGTPTVSGFNMAEAVAKSPRVQTASQVSNGNQRFEDLAIKQSRILIPVTPSAPKIMALNPSDRSKSKVLEPRPQNHLPSPSHLSNHSVRAEGLATSDASKTSRKLLVLKPTRERNGVSFVSNTTSEPSRDVKAAMTTMQRSSSNPVSPTAAEGKPDKRLSSQARSRNDFFNLMRKKKSMGDSGASSETLVDPDTSTPQYASQGQDSESDKKYVLNEEKMLIGNVKTHPSPDALLCSEEEEAAFLRSLGWEENADEGGLTEEEISAFYRDVTKYLNSKLPLKILQGVQPRLLLKLNS